MEGSGAHGVPPVSGGVTGMVSAAAKGGERRREDGPMESAEEFEVAADAGDATSCREEVELGNEATGAGEGPATTSSDRKRKRDADPEDGGTQQAAEERLPTTLVQQPAVASAPAPLQRLVDACRAVFGASGGAPPMASVVPVIRGIMDTIEPDDVGLRQDLRYFNRMNTRGRQNPPIITCKTILQCTNFTIAVFFLPLRAVMPLHDHPGMTVHQGAHRVGTPGGVRLGTTPRHGHRWTTDACREGARPRRHAGVPHLDAVPGRRREYPPVCGR